MSLHRHSIDEMRRRAEIRREAAERARWGGKHFDYEKSARESQMREDFLRESAAFPTPAECYALWLAVYLEQGGSAEHANHNFAENWHSEDYRYYHNLMPTAWKDSPLSIPVGYGATSMDLLIFEDLVNIDLRPTSGDKRPRWEYGHTTVYVLKKGDGPFGLCASTNELGYVWSYPDVEGVLLGDSVGLLADAYHRRLKMLRTNGAE